MRNGKNSKMSYNETLVGAKTEVGQVPEVQINQANVEESVRDILINIGENPEREGLLKTPNRVARMFDELTAGYHMDAEKLINNAIFSVDYDEMVVVKDIEYYSLCEHHMLPFFGKAHVAYIPDGKVIGLSKIPRIVEMFARRLQIQEQMTSQIADFIKETLNATGVAVVLEGSHMCGMMRGVRSQNTKMTTRRMLGDFKHNKDLRQEFIEHIASNSLD
ncbi:MAG: GTP cyclohydrolase I FolE [Chloroflexi bacterium]|jgi:GTP cyclohydrolase IA|nr:GTP cyclohydrolase I FolE [Chloroflexota bacterium]MBT3669708.1 GTP cyclohydrolase I FolE [Chloroflexota bacterium]MBT4002804.1 GTP cyclohydrolase I FolE [Chloroflexota bacterium]MBT4305638.1 GTP cyclohydrolase I FolE [Chloroflexota bacterium]MBT4533795.1 GTP cyclohydrolase I FolE [Chloroflexota bacterium]